MPTTTISLTTFFEELERYEERVPLPALTRLMASIALEQSDLEEYACFADETYQRNQVRRSSGYEALLLCWKPGQKSPIHDHKGSCCGVRILKGRLTETSFKRGANGLLMACRSVVMNEGDVCGSQDMDIHQVSNLHHDLLMTLHIYTPPLERMGTYSLTDGTVREYENVIHAFCHGAGI